MDFRPTHELFDANGESCGLYRDGGDHWVDAHVWFEGGRPVFHKEAIAWGWTGKALTTLFREHYAHVHGRDGSDCSDGCGGY